MLTRDDEWIVFILRNYRAGIWSYLTKEEQDEIEAAYRKYFPPPHTLKNNTPSIGVGYDYRRSEERSN
jgi:hypothetical protein